MPLLFLLIAALGNQSAVVSLYPAGLNSFDVSIGDFRSISGTFIGSLNCFQATNSIVCNVSFNFATETGIGTMDAEMDHSSGAVEPATDEGACGLAIGNPGF